MTSLPAQIEAVRAACERATEAVDSGGHEQARSYQYGAAESHLAALTSVLMTLQQYERLEAEVARLSETAGEDYERGVQSGMKLSADHIERLEAVVKAARKLMDERKAGSATLFLNMAALTEALAALDTAAPETPADMPPINPSEGASDG